MLISWVLLLQSCFSDRKKASNLEAYVEWFNRLSYLVATEICVVSPGRRALPNTWGAFRILDCGMKSLI